MNVISHSIRMRQTRRGAILPAIVFAMLVIGAIAALVLNRLWLDAASSDLQSAAEAAALAAAGDYLGDDLLRENYDPQQNLLHAKQRAAEVAAVNYVAGESLPLQIDGNDPDIIFGKRVRNDLSGESTFLLTEKSPNTVEVRTRRVRDNGNPIPLFLAGVTGRGNAERIRIVEAGFDNLIDHFQPTPYRPLPAFPLAILAKDPSGKRLDTWQNQIEQRCGLDRYGFNEQTNEVVAQPDGIPELELNSVPLDTDPLAANVQLLDFRNDLRETEIIPQIQTGLSIEDLAEWNGQIPTHRPLSMTGMATITTEVQRAFETMLGQQRLCLLYHQASELSVPGWTSLTCEGIVAIRVMRVIPESGEAATLIVQPTVMTTKSAVLAKFVTEDQFTSLAIPRLEQETRLYAPNRYVYNIYLNR